AVNERDWSMGYRRDDSDHGRGERVVPQPLTPIDRIRQRMSGGDRLSGCNVPREIFILGKRQVACDENPLICSGGARDAEHDETQRPDRFGLYQRAPSPGRLAGSWMHQAATWSWPSHGIR